MEISDFVIWGALIVLVLMVFFTLHTIFAFTPAVNQCQESFKMINQCGCVPDQQLATLLGAKNYYHPINISGVPNEN